jgi:predicted ATPase
MESRGAQDGERKTITALFADIKGSVEVTSWQLRAVTSLSRLLQKQARNDEARRMLAEIYGWFSEGFDTADLKDAKVLLEELST